MTPSNYYPDPGEVPKDVPGILLLKGAAPFSITEHHRLGNKKQSHRREGETFYYSHPQRADSMCINMGNRASENSEDTDESSWSQMVLGTDNHLFKGFYSLSFYFFFFF